MNNENSLIGGEIPLGLGMALAQNSDAMKHFANLSEQEKQNVIDRTHQIGSKEEMQQFVDSLA